MPRLRRRMRAIFCNWRDDSKFKLYDTARRFTDDLFAAHRDGLRCPSCNQRDPFAFCLNGGGKGKVPVKRRYRHYCPIGRSRFMVKGEVMTGKTLTLGCPDMLMSFLMPLLEVEIKKGGNRGVAAHKRLLLCHRALDKIARSGCQVNEGNLAMRLKMLDELHRQPDESDDLQDIPCTQAEPQRVVVLVPSLQGVADQGRVIAEAEERNYNVSDDGMEDGIATPPLCASRSHDLLYASEASLLEVDPRLEARPTGSLAPVDTGRQQHFHDAPDQVQKESSSGATADIVVRNGFENNEISWLTIRASGEAAILPIPSATFQQQPLSSIQSVCIPLPATRLSHDSIPGLHTLSSIRTPSPPRPRFHVPEVPPGFGDPPYMVQDLLNELVVQHTLTPFYLKSIACNVCPSFHLHPAQRFSGSVAEFYQRRNSNEVGRFDDSAFPGPLGFQQKQHYFNKDIVLLSPGDRSWSDISNATMNLLHAHPYLHDEPSAVIEHRAAVLPFHRAVNEWGRENEFGANLMKSTLAYTNVFLDLVHAAQLSLFHAEQQQQPRGDGGYLRPPHPIQVAPLECRDDAAMLSATQTRHRPDVYVVQAQDRVVATVTLKMWCNRTLLRYCKDQIGAPLPVVGAAPSRSLEAGRFHLLNQIVSQSIAARASLLIVYNGDDCIVFERDAAVQSTAINGSFACSLRPWPLGFTLPRLPDTPPEDDDGEDFLQVNPAWLFTCLAHYASTLPSPAPDQIVTYRSAVNATRRS